MVKLSINGVTKAFGPMKAVDNVSLVFGAGEFIALLGPSGCGKTTMLRMIAGFESPTAGTINSAGRLLSSPKGMVPPERRNMSMIFQSYAVWPNMTVAANVAFGLELRGIGRQEIRAQVRHALELVQMAGLSERFPAELSGGQQQRVALARALIVRPDILLMDEPLSNLDANLREEMRSEIRRVHDEMKITTIYVTHDQSEAMAMADRIVVMNQGAVEQVGGPFDVYNAPATRFVASFIGRANILRLQTRDGALRVGPFAASQSDLFPNVEARDGLSIAVRPHSIGLSVSSPGAPPGTLIAQGTVVSRTYLGEFWSYQVQPADCSSAPLHILTPPSERVEPDQAVWLRVSPTSLAPLRD